MTINDNETPQKENPKYGWEISFLIPCYNEKEDIFLKNFI